MGTAQGAEGRKSARHTGIRALEGGLVRVDGGDLSALVGPPARIGGILGLIVEHHEVTYVEDAAGGGIHGASHGQPVGRGIDVSIEAQRSVASSSR